MKVPKFSGITTILPQLKICLTIFLLYLLSSYIDWQSFSRQFADFRFWDLVALILFLLIAIVFYAIRWVIIVKSICGRHASAHAIFATYFESLIFAIMTPGGLGGDAYRVSQAAKFDASKTNIVSSIIVEKVGGFFFFAGCAVLFLGRINIRDGDFFFLLFLFLLFFIILVVFPEFIFRGLARVFSIFPENRFSMFFLESFSEINEFLQAPSSSFYFFSLSLVCLVLYAFGVGSISSSLGCDWSFFDMLMLLGFIEVVRQLPITVQGVGLREGLFSMYATNLWGWSFEQGILISGLFYVFITLVFGGIGGLFMFRASFRS